MRSGPFNKQGQFNERGAVGGVEGMAFGVLVFVFGTLVLVSAWGVVDAHMATSAAAREAARGYVESDSTAEGSSLAQLAVANSLDKRHLGPWTIDIDPATTGAQLVRCDAVTVTVSVRMNRMPLRLIGRKGGVVTISESHTEVIDPYRSGLRGPANCPR